MAPLIGEDRVSGIGGDMVWNVGRLLSCGEDGFKETVHLAEEEVIPVLAAQWWGERGSELAVHGCWRELMMSDGGGGRSTTV